MKYKMGYFRELVATLCLTSICLVYAQNVAQRTVGPVQCLKDPVQNTLTVRFVSKLNGDDINHVFGCTEDPVDSGQCSYSNCSLTKFTVGSDKYLTVESVIDINVTDPVADGANVNGCGFKAVTNVTLGDGFRFRIGLRKEPGFLHGIDNDYIYTCYDGQALSTVLVTSLVVDTQDPIDQAIVNPEVAMFVLKENGAGVYERATTCQLGENMQLEIVMTQEQYQDYLVPWGLYAMNTRVAPFANMSSADVLLTNTGCALDPNVLDMVGGFTRYTAGSSQTGSTVTSVYRSGTFQCKRYLRVGSDDLHFDTAIQFCSGAYEQDAMCNDFCATNINRRRRAAEQEETPDVQELYVSITVLDDDESQDSDRAEVGGTVLDGNLIAIIAVCGVICCLLFVCILVFICIRRRTIYRDNESQTSSRRIIHARKI